MNKLIKKHIRAAVVSSLSLVLWFGIFLLFDFTTTTYSSPKEVQRAIEKAPTKPMSEQEFEKRSQEARRLIQEQIAQDKQRLRSDPFIHIRKKSVIWTWIPWFLCALVIGFRGAAGYCIVLSTSLIVLALGLISVEAVLVIAISVFAANGLRDVALKLLSDNES